MKLISCYIENFGGLSQFSCDFNSGITELQEPNGFGKTTFAEFIRAMFYGFPRANKSVKKDRRKKYRPWQGGKYGGNLVFEHEGEQYRIERFFGEKPSSDTFELYDMSAHRRSRKFSSEIGVELFQLDSDSFERSTYLPQLYDSDSLSTDNIQAKLGDLVDDTNDINNFEKAITAIRAKRTTLDPYRGSGGAIAFAQQKISELEEMLSESRSQKPKLEQLQQEASKKKTQLEIKEAAGRSVLEKISQVSEAARKKAVADQFSQMKNTYSQRRHEQEELQRKYPSGFPTMNEIGSLLQIYDDLAPLKGQGAISSSYDSAKQYLRENEDRFASGIPTGDDFSACGKLCRDHTEKNSLLQSLELSADEKEKLKNLESFFSAGIPDEKFIADCKEHRQNIQNRQAEASSQNLPLSQQTRLENLQIFFGGKVPLEDELSAKQQELQKTERLKQENNSIASSVVAPITSDNSSHKKNAAFLPVLLFGIAAIIASVVLLTQQLFAIGGGALGLGVILSVFAIYLRLKDMVSGKISESSHGVPQISEIDKQRIRDNETEIRRLEQSIGILLSQYNLTGSISEKLSELQAKQREYLSLENMKRSFNENQTDLQKEIQSSQAWLEENLSPYFGSEIPPDAHSILNWKISEYKNLQNKYQKSNEESARLHNEINLTESKIRAFLEPYTGSVKAEDFSSCLAALRQECAAYIQNQKIVSEYETDSAKREEKLLEYGKRISEFSQQYGLDLDIDSRQAVQSLRDDARDYFELVDLIAGQKKEIEEFTEKNKDIIAAPRVDEQYDLEELQDIKKHLDNEISDIGKSLLETEQEIKNIRAEVDLIPQKEDELDNWKSKFAADRQQAELLDETIDFLQRAKEQLSTNYLGTVRHSFSDLLHRLTGEMSKNILVNAQLDVQLERHGETRSTDYFSAGQLDIITLCMRIALVEALFKDVKPFIILDDPFVNLDDKHTAEALALLKELAEEYQIIYLVCNSSRALETTE